MLHICQQEMTNFRPCIGAALEVDQVPEDPGGLDQAKPDWVASCCLHAPTYDLQIRSNFWKYAEVSCT